MATPLPGKPPKATALDPRKETSASAAVSKPGGTSEALAMASNELVAQRLPVPHEAAVLFAADHAQAAVDLLKEYLKDPTGKNSLQAWLMLFDLYQLTGNRKEFEALSVVFVVKFERSAPTWKDGSLSTDPRRKEKRETKDFFVLRPSPVSGLVPEIERMVSFARQAKSIRIDLSKLNAISADEAAKFIIALQGLRMTKTPVWFNGFDHAEHLLKARMANAGADRQRFFELLFELYMIEGREKDFEELSLEYAVAFEVSPPIWETVERPGGQPAAEVAAQPEAQSKDGFSLRGTLSEMTKSEVQDLLNYAAGNSEVHISMEHVPRIDFTYMGVFGDALRGIHGAQKRVVLSNMNELVFGLLEVFGINKFAILLRRKVT